MNYSFSVSNTLGGPSRTPLLEPPPPQPPLTNLLSTQPFPLPSAPFHRTSIWEAKVEMAFLYQ